MKQKLFVGLTSLVLLSSLAAILFSPEVNNYSLGVKSTVDLSTEAAKLVSSNENNKLAEPILPAEKEKFRDSLTLQVKPGDTFSGILESAGISKNIGAKIVAELQKIYNPALIKVGQVVNFKFTPDANQNPELLALNIPVDGRKDVDLVRNKDGEFVAQETKKELKYERASLKGWVKGSLYASAEKIGLPIPVLNKFIKLYSYDIDFQRDIKEGNKFNVFYERWIDPKTGQVADSGDILYAQIEVGGKVLKSYRYQVAAGDMRYFNENGESIEKSFLKTPVDGARITSGFGNREHPILGYTKMHKGVDFGAPRGTPIYAAGSGRIAFMGRFSGYGNYVKINHSSGYSTAYGHMNKFASNLARGMRVKQGQLIGYVGSTGMATGPHLHYEVLANNVQINPKTIKSLPGVKLAGRDFAKFSEFKQYVSAKVNTDTEFAEAKP